MYFIDQIKGQYMSSIISPLEKQSAQNLDSQNKTPEKKEKKVENPKTLRDEALSFGKAVEDDAESAVNQLGRIKWEKQNEETLTYWEKIPELDTNWDVITWEWNEKNNEKNDWVSKNPSEKTSENSEEVVELWKLEAITSAKLVKELQAKYWKEKTATFTEMIQEMKDSWKIIPDSMEAIEAMLEDYIAKKEALELRNEDPTKPLEEWVVREAASNVLQNGSPDQMKSYNTPSESWKNVDFAPGNASQDIWQLTDAISNAPNEKARVFLEAAKRMIWKDETQDRAELKSFLWFDPKSTPWCKWFTNACAKEAGISLASAGSLYSRAWANDWEKRRIPWEKPLPGDIVIVERAGSAGWAPAGHIWIFVWMSPNWKPIIVWWNQGWSREWGGWVTISEERRPIVSINNVSWARTSSESLNRAMS